MCVGRSLHGFESGIQRYDLGEVLQRLAKWGRLWKIAHENNLNST